MSYDGILIICIRFCFDQYYTLFTLSPFPTLEVNFLFLCFFAFSLFCVCLVYRTFPLPLLEVSCSRMQMRRPRWLWLTL